MGREAGPPIIGLAPQASCRHGRVTSNVRRHVRSDANEPPALPTPSTKANSGSSVYRPVAAAMKRSAKTAPEGTDSLVRLPSALRASVLRRAVSSSGTAQARCERQRGAHVIHPTTSKRSERSSERSGARPVACATPEHRRPSHCAHPLRQAVRFIPGSPRELAAQ